MQCAERTLYHWDGVRITLPPSITHRICSAPLSSPASPSAPESDAPAADVSAAAPLVAPVQQSATATATPMSAAESPVSIGYTVRNMSEPPVYFLFSFAHGTWFRLLLRVHLNSLLMLLFLSCAYKLSLGENFDNTFLFASFMCVICASADY